MFLSDFFPLAIFPEGGLASAVVTTIWVGIAVVVFFNLRFGWVLSGLVIPGYLVPLLLAKPASAAVVLVEGVLTYALVWLYSEYLAGRIGWSNFFGRDRFFALVLCNVLIRVVADGFVLPVLGEWMIQSFHIQFDYRNNLHSFGLIIGALIANNFWKTGWRVGLLQVLTTTGITLLIVRYGLMAATNFNISSLAYEYEDIASSILASPKAYIILLSTAFLASRMNLLYGWDFAGILIPSLLALQWYQPEKIVATFVESGIILLLAALLYRLPLFRGATIEGGRKILLFFNISYFYKFMLAYLLIRFFPEQKITDMYGFGYLLPTLIAVKMHDKDIHARMSRATLQTSLMAAFGATIVGFALAQIPDPWRSDVPHQGETPVPRVIRDETLPTAVRDDQIAAYRSRLKAQGVVPTPDELMNFRQGLLNLAEYRRAGNEQILGAGVALLDSVGFRVDRIEDRYLLLREKEPRRFWGIYAIDLKAGNELAVEVPAPLDERGTAESAIWLMRHLGAQALAVASDGRQGQDVLLSTQTIYQTFHLVFGIRETLQVRGFSRSAARLAGSKRQPGAETGYAPEKSTLWIKGGLPEPLDLGLLKQLVGTFEVRWGELTLRNMQRETTPSGFAELRLRPEDIRRLLGRARGRAESLAQIEDDRSIEGYLQDWLLQDKTRIAASGSNLYRKPVVEELLFLEDEVVMPLLDAARAYYANGQWNGDGLVELRNIRAHAAVFGYELLRYRHRGSSNDYLILAESADNPRYWGTYVFRLGKAAPFIVQTPRPIYEVNTFEFGVAVFESLGAEALLIGGSSPEANFDHSADIVKFANKENLFNVVNQALLRSAGDTPRLVVQTRAAGSRPELPMPSSDVLVATTTGALDVEQFSRLGRNLLRILDRYGMSHALASGHPSEAGYEVGGLPPVLYLNATRNKEFVTLWLSPLARAKFAQQSETTPQTEQAMALGLRTVNEEITRYLARHGNALAPLPDSLRAAMRPYFANQDIVALHAAIARHPELRFERLVDMGSRQGFLAVKNPRDELLALANLSASDGEKVVRFSPRAARDSLDAFVEARQAWLLGGGEGAP